MSNFNFSINMSRNQAEILGAIGKRYNIPEDELVKVFVHLTLDKFETGLMPSTGNIEQDLSAFDDSISSLNSRISSSINSAHKAVSDSKYILSTLGS